ncbi:MAG: integrase core domain-containing protein [Flagellimonas sp.]
MRTLTDKWMEDYNTKHPHSVLNDTPPREYKDRFGEEFFPETTIIDQKLLNLELS